VRSGGRKVLVLPIHLRVAATPYASCRNIFHRSSGHLTDWHHGETTNTAFVESTIKRFVKKRSRSQLKRCEADNPIRRHARWGGPSRITWLARPTIARTKGRMATRNG
jgi:hypothetical protein